MRESRRFSFAVGVAPLAVERLKKAFDGTHGFERLKVTLLEDLPVTPGMDLALYDGKLRAEYARLLDRNPPTLLCALDPDGGPQAGAGVLLAHAVGNRNLDRQLNSLRRLPVDSVDQVAVISREVEALCDTEGTPATGALAADIVHELVTNALLAAPVDGAGRPRYAHRRDSVRTVSPEDACLLKWGLLGNQLFVSATDRFGRLDTAPWSRAMASWGRPVKVNASGGGAGLGLRRVLEHADVIAVRVDHRVSTEVVVALSLDGPRKRSSLSKSFFFVRRIPGLDSGAGR
ncbi:MAG: hypothetical protein K1X89_29170 [Myxococcaceae bacterium]|nr:hypothetical protein [Myxococcaceae bacterium]